MLKLKYTEKRIISDDNWDSFVQAIYKRPYCFQQQDGCKERGIYTFKVPQNGTEDRNQEDYEYGVPFEEWLAADSKDMSEMKWHREFFPDITMIIEDLYSEGLIEAGNYIINIDW